MSNRRNRLNAALLAMAGFAVAGMLLTTIVAFAGSTTQPEDAANPPISTGRHIDASVANASQNVGSMPINAILSPDGKYVITTGDGATEELCSVRVADGKAASAINFVRGALPNNGLYYGLAFGSDGRLYAAQGGAGAVTIFKIDANGILTHEGDFMGQPTDFPAGIAADARGRIYVTQNDPTSSNDIRFGTPASVSIIDTASNKEIGRHVFADPLGLSNFPLAVAVNDDGSRLYVGSQRDDAVYVLDASDPDNVKLVTKLSTGSHPNALLLNKARTKLYVANTQSDTISIVETATQNITATVLLRPDIASHLAGATPTGLALSADEDTLYSSLGDMNAVAVLDVDDATPRVKGYIPAGWYPTAVAVADDSLFVVNAKGNLARVPHNAMNGTGRVGTPLAILQGTVLKIAIPTDDELAKLTNESLENARLTPKYLNGENPLAAVSKSAGKISHVIYIVKENRTYDQVLGDIPQGNGDPARCIFGSDVTPNQHAFAERFVMFDNFYDCGEVSGDGWTWSTRAQGNEDTIRNVPYEYAGRGRAYDYAGTNNDYPTGGLPAKGPDGVPLSDDPRFKNGAPPVADIDQPAGGQLWDMAKKQGLSYRNFGFFLTQGVYDGDKTVIPDNYPAVAGLQPGAHDLDGLTDVDFRDFDLSYPDSEATSTLAEAKKNSSLLWNTRSYGKNNAVSRFSEWKRSFDMMLANDPTGNSVPALMFVRFPNDHTGGAGSGSPSPRAMVADNDYACGQLVDAISHSPIWKSTAIVIIEDDAQNGPDHVDIHRSTCYLISPYIKKNSVDHSFQSTISAIKTMECLLGLPPMCQYDAASDCLGGWDTTASNDEPYTATMASEKILLERGGAFNRGIPVSPETPRPRPGATPAAQAPIKLDSLAALAQTSDQMDFKTEDKAPADELNRIIWKTVRGVDSEPPPTPHTIVYGQVPEKDSD